MTKITKNEPARDSILPTGRKFETENAGRLNAALNDRDFEEMSVVLGDAHDAIKALKNPNREKQIRELMLVLPDVVEAAEEERHWSLLRIILSVLALGIPFIIDARERSEAIELANKVKARLDKEGRGEIIRPKEGPPKLFERTNDRFSKTPPSANIFPGSGVSPMLAGLEPKKTQAPNSVSKVNNPGLKKAFDALPLPGGPAQTKLLSGNTEAWVARWDMLENATDSIDATYFILEKDPIGFAFLGHLLKKKREGVEVRLMTDAMADTFGEAGFTAAFRGLDYLEELAGADIPVKIYNPLSLRLITKLNNGLLASNHDKILVVDGKTSMTGGRNIADDYFLDPTDDPTAWRDTDILITGKGAADGMTSAFEAEFNHDPATYDVTGDILGNWVKRDIELTGAYLLMDLWLNDTSSEPVPTDEAGCKNLIDSMLSKVYERLPSEGIEREVSDREKESLQSIAAQLIQASVMRGSKVSYDTTAGVDRASVKIADSTSLAGTELDNIDDSLIAVLGQAKDEIIIENPYVVLPDRMLRALKELGDNGVKTTIITNSPLSTDSTATQAFFLEEWANALAAVPNLRILVATGERKLHAKTAVIDREVTIVSTYNMDFLSAQVNSEIASFSHSPELAARTLKTYEADVTDPANGFVEYTIARNEDGTPRLTDSGDPIVTFGPEDHLTDKMLESYESIRAKASWIRRIGLLQSMLLKRPGTDPGEFDES